MGVLIGRHHGRGEHRKAHAQRQRRRGEGRRQRRLCREQQQERRRQPHRHAAAQHKGDLPGYGAGIVGDILQCDGAVIAAAQPVGEGPALLVGAAGPQADGIVPVQKVVGVRRAPLHKSDAQPQRFIPGGRVGGVEQEIRKGVVQHAHAGHAGARQTGALFVHQLHRQLAGAEGMVIGCHIQPHAIQPGVLRQLDLLIQAGVRHADDAAVFIVLNGILAHVVHREGQVIPCPRGKEQRTHQYQQRPEQRTVPRQQRFEFLHGGTSCYHFIIPFFCAKVNPGQTAARPGLRRGVQDCSERNQRAISGTL